MNEGIFDERIIKMQDKTADLKLTIESFKFGFEII